MYTYIHIYTYTCIHIYMKRLLPPTGDPLVRPPPGVGLRQEGRVGGRDARQAALTDGIRQRQAAQGGGRGRDRTRGRSGGVAGLLALDSGGAYIFIYIYIYMYMYDVYMYVCMYMYIYICIYTGLEGDPEALLDFSL